jgi:hypothetical protein
MSYCKYQGKIVDSIALAAPAVRMVVVSVSVTRNPAPYNGGDFLPLPDADGYYVWSVVYPVLALVASAERHYATSSRAALDPGLPPTHDAAESEGWVFAEHITAYDVLVHTRKSMASSRPRKRSIRRMKNTGSSSVCGRNPRMRGGSPESWRNWPMPPRSRIRSVSIAQAPGVSRRASLKRSPRCWQWLALQGIRVHRRNVGLIRQEYKGKSRWVRFAEPGMCDYWFILPDGSGRHIEMEWKRPGAWPRPAQIVWMISVNARGGTAFWARDLTTVDIRGNVITAG